MRLAHALNAVVIALLLGLANASPVAAEPLAPHEVLSVETGETRRIVAIRLPRRVSEDDLARIAAAMRKNDEPQGRRTLVNFYLPGMRLTDACWASASFAPQLKITVNGLTLDEETAFRAAATAERRAVVGMWLTEAPAAPGLLVIYREKGRAYADWRLRSGHRTVEEVVESRGQNGRRFDIVGDQNQHYVLVSGGALELREKAGVIAVADPLKPMPPLFAGKDGPAKPAAAAKTAAAATASGVPSSQTVSIPATPAAAPAALMRPVVTQPTRTAALGPGFTVIDTEAAAEKPSAPPVAETASVPPAAAAAAATHAHDAKPPVVEKPAAEATQPKAAKKIVKAHVKPKATAPAPAARVQVKAAPPVLAPQQPRMPADLASAARRYIN